MSAYRNPLPTVDIIIEIDNGLVLIERKNPPLGWALPGGFVDEGEPLWSAALREAREETMLEVSLVEQFFCYSAPDRDPRRHTISVVYIARATGKPEGADDAREAKIFPTELLPPDCAFDHRKILDDYLHYRKTGERPPVLR